MKQLSQQRIGLGFWSYILNCSLLFALLLVGPGSCGGGTVGTGVRDVQGRVVNRANVGLANVTVTIETNGRSSITDADGYFLIEDGLDAAAADVSIMLETDDGRSVRTDLNDLLPSEQPLEVEIIVNFPTNEVQVIVSTPVPTGTPTPQPSATPGSGTPNPGSSPTPTPPAGVTASPTPGFGPALPTPSPTSTTNGPRPTSTPTATPTQPASDDN